MTIHHNWIHDTNQRNPSTDNVAYAHLYNNYLQNVTVVRQLLPRGATKMVLENSYFENVKDPYYPDTTRAAAAERQHRRQLHRQPADPRLRVHAEQLLPVHARPGRQRPHPAQDLRRPAGQHRRLTRPDTGGFRETTHVRPRPDGRRRPGRAGGDRPTPRARGRRAAGVVGCASSGLSGHPLLVRGAGGRPRLADDARGEGRPTSDEQRAGHSTARGAAVHVLERGSARRQPARGQHQQRRRRRGSARHQLSDQLRQQHVLGSRAHPPGDDGHLRRGARFSRQVPLGRGAEQHRPGPERLRVADVLGAHGQPRPRPALGPHGRGLRRGSVPGGATGRSVRQRLPGPDAARAAHVPTT